MNVLSRVNITGDTANADLVEPMELGVKPQDKQAPENALMRHEISISQIKLNDSYAETKDGEGLIPGDLIRSSWKPPNASHYAQELGVYLGKGRMAVTPSTAIYPRDRSVEEVYHKKEKPLIVDLAKREGSQSVKAISIMVREGDR